MITKKVKSSDKEAYVKPDAELVAFDAKDIITASDGNFDGKEDEF